MYHYDRDDFICLKTKPGPKEDLHKRCVHFYACICAFASDEKLQEEFEYYINLDANCKLRRNKVLITSYISIYSTNHHLEHVRCIRYIGINRKLILSKCTTCTSNRLLDLWSQCFKDARAYTCIYFRSRSGQHATYIFNIQLLYTDVDICR